MVESNCIKFANNVKKYREQLGYNKSRMSELLDCDLSYIGKIERSEKFPNLKLQKFYKFQQKTYLILNDTHYYCVSFINLFQIIPVVIFEIICKPV